MAAINTLTGIGLLLAAKWLQNVIEKNKVSPDILCISGIFLCNEIVYRLTKTAYFNDPQIQP